MGTYKPISLGNSKGKLQLKGTERGTSQSTTKVLFLLVVVVVEIMTTTTTTTTQK
jgi:hypothetical protein